ncbi:HAD family hydrolase [Rhodococcoides yunnanense]|uniref:HAD family hydrolase n=1 Tax=Rhodococcoides yunnanense TaxID=278209 RepID=A0ABU4BIX9_9NOCA|nr:HAD family hydrolase [Rhodococcus yunnanensis]MDV6264178.1 HAD family hydrolase [Rhodococcus yunnanensis]
MTEIPTPIESVIFDFSGTLFRLEPNSDWNAPDLSSDELDTVVSWLTEPAGPPVPLNDEHHRLWELRDLDPSMHRIVYTEILGRFDASAGADVLPMLDVLVDPLRWTPYPDTAAVLEKLCTAGIPVAVLSNISFDIRPAFASRGWDRWVETFVLSYELGAVKPDPIAFTTAIERIGGRPETTLMIGDSPGTDGAAASVGCAIALVESMSTRSRPDALLSALAAHHVDL